MSYWASLAVPSEHEFVVGLYDLTRYTAYCERNTSARALDLIARYHALAGRIIHDSGGLLIKAIGDAGLFAYPSSQADGAIAAVQRLRAEGDTWLASEGFPGYARTVMHVGEVSVGPIGGPGREQLDIIGRTVNTVGAMRTAGALAITPDLFRRLSPSSRRLFKKHTPPVSYIGVDDPRPA